jgi:hypothetical protein
VGLADRFKKSSHDRHSVELLLTGRGASQEEADEIIKLLETRLSPDAMHDWLAHPKKSHGIADPEAGGSFGVELKWTPVNAIAAGKTDLVIDEARRLGTNS